MEIPDKMSASEFQRLIQTGVIDISGKRMTTSILDPKYSEMLSQDRQHKQGETNKFLLVEFEAYIEKKYKMEIIQGESAEVPFSKLFDTDRKFRADYFISDIKAIIEINGGEYGKPVQCNHCGEKVQYSNGKQVFSQGGRHTGSTGYSNDLFKSNLAQCNGFKFYQFNYKQLKDKTYREFI